MKQKEGFHQSWGQSTFWNMSIVQYEEWARVIFCRKLYSKLNKCSNRCMALVEAWSNWNWKKNKPLLYLYFRWQGSTFVHNKAGLGMEGVPALTVTQWDCLPGPSPWEKHAMISLKPEVTLKLCNKKKISSFKMLSYQRSHKDKMNDGGFWQMLSPYS